MVTLGEQVRGVTRRRATRRTEEQEQEPEVSQEEFEKQYRQEQLERIDEFIENRRNAIKANRRILRSSTPSAERQKDRASDRIAKFNDEINSIKEVRRRIQSGENISYGDAREYAKAQGRRTLQRQELNRAEFRERQVIERQLKAKKEYEQRQRQKLEGRGIEVTKSGALVNVRPHGKATIKDLSTGKVTRIPTSQEIQQRTLRSVAQLEGRKIQARPSAPEAQQVVRAKDGRSGISLKKAVGSFTAGLPSRVERTGDFSLGFGEEDFNLGFRLTSKKQREREARERQIGRDEYSLRQRQRKTERVFAEFERTKEVPAGIEEEGYDVEFKETDGKVVVTLRDVQLERKIETTSEKFESYRADDYLNKGFFRQANEAVSESIKRGEAQKQELLSTTKAGRSVLYFEKFGTGIGRLRFLLTSDVTYGETKRFFKKAILTSDVVLQLEEQRASEGAKEKRDKVADVLEDYSEKTRGKSFLISPLLKEASEITRKKSLTAKGTVAEFTKFSAYRGLEAVEYYPSLEREFKQKPVTYGSLFVASAAISGGTSFFAGSNVGVLLTQSTGVKFVGSLAGTIVAGAYIGSKARRIARSPQGEARARTVAQISLETGAILAGATVGSKVGKFARAKTEEIYLKRVLKKQKIELKELTSATKGGHPSVTTGKVKDIPKEFRESPYKLPGEYQKLQARRGFHTTTAYPKFIGKRVIKTKSGVRVERIFRIESGKSTLPTGEPRGLYVSNQISTGRLGGDDVFSYFRDPNIFGVGSKQVTFRLTGTKDFVTVPIGSRSPLLSQKYKVKYIEELAPRGQGIYPLQKTELEAVFPSAFKGRDALVITSETGYYTTFQARPIYVEQGKVLSEIGSGRVATKLGLAQAQGGSYTEFGTRRTVEYLSVGSSGSSSPSPPTMSNVPLLLGLSSGTYDVSGSIPSVDSASYETTTSISYSLSSPVSSGSTSPSTTSSFSSGSSLPSSPSSPSPSSPSSPSTTTTTTTTTTSSTSGSSLLTPPFSAFPSFFQERRRFRQELRRLTRQKSRRYYIPDFTARVLGLEKEITKTQAKRLLRKSFTGFEIRPSVKVLASRKGKRRKRRRKKKEENLVAQELVKLDLGKELKGYSKKNKSLLKGVL